MDVFASSWKRLGYTSAQVKELIAGMIRELSTFVEQETKEAEERLIRENSKKILKQKYYELRQFIKEFREKEGMSSHNFNLIITYYVITGEIIDISTAHCLIEKLKEAYEVCADV